MKKLSLSLFVVLSVVSFGQVVSFQSIIRNADSSLVECKNATLELVLNGSSFKSKASITRGGCTWYVQVNGISKFKDSLEYKIDYTGDGVYDITGKTGIHPVPKSRFSYFSEKSKITDSVSGLDVNYIKSAVGESNIVRDNVENIYSNYINDTVYVNNLVVNTCVLYNMVDSLAKDARVTQDIVDSTDILVSGISSSCDSIGVIVDSLQNIMKIYDSIYTSSGGDIKYRYASTCGNMYGFTSNIDGDNSKFINTSYTDGSDATDLILDIYTPDELAKEIGVNSIDLAISSGYHIASIFELSDWRDMGLLERSEYILKSRVLVSSTFDINGDLLVLNTDGTQQKVSNDHHLLSCIIFVKKIQ